MHLNTDLLNGLKRSHFPVIGLATLITSASDTLPISTKGSNASTIWICS